MDGKRHLGKGHGIVIILLLLLTLSIGYAITLHTYPDSLPYELIFWEQISVDGPPNDGYQKLPCQMVYGDNITSCRGETINVSLQVGAAKTAQDAVYATKHNLRRLNSLYHRQLDGVCTSNWGGDWIGWSDRIFVKHRTDAQKYQVNGWYILALDWEGAVHGTFFLSDGGSLMPAQQTCTRAECCL